MSTGWGVPGLISALPPACWGQEGGSHGSLSHSLSNQCIWVPISYTYLPEDVSNWLAAVMFVGPVYRDGYARTRAPLVLVLALNLVYLCAISIELKCNHENEPGIS